MLDKPHCLIITTVINRVLTVGPRHCAQWFTSIVSFNPLQTLWSMALSSLYYEHGSCCVESLAKWLRCLMMHYLIMMEPRFLRGLTAPKNPSFWFISLGASPQRPNFKLTYWNWKSLLLIPYGLVLGWVQATNIYPFGRRVNLFNCFIILAEIFSSRFVAIIKQFPQQFM